ncbi:MAG: TonB-dependent receptor [Bacteroidota bacterium]
MRLLATLSLAALLAVLAPASAQPGGMGAPLIGTVVGDDTGEPVVGANVAIYQRDAFLTGAATNLDGQFEIGLRPGTYRVRVSFIGYESFQQEEVAVRAGSPTDMGTITLTANSALLDAAEVTAEREFIEQQADRTVYNVQEQAVTAGGNALETLQTLPSVEVDTDGNVSLRGNQNVAIQINGRPVPVSGAFLAALLRQIGSDRIDRVEVIPNPSARYEPDGMGGIINIELMEGTDRGLSGGLTFGGGTEPSANIGGNVSYQQGAWDLNAQYGFRFDDPARFSTTLQRRPIADSDQTFVSDQGGDLGNLSQSHFFNGSALYAFSRSTDLTIEGSFGIRDSDDDTRFEFNNSVLDENLNPVSTSLFFRDTGGQNDGINGDLALVFRQTYEGEGGEASGSTGGATGGSRQWGRGGPRGGGGVNTDHELAVEARYTLNDNENIGLFSNLDADEDLTFFERQFTTNTTGQSRFQVDYTRPVGALKLETGLLVTDERVGNELAFGACGDPEDPTAAVTLGCGEGGPLTPVAGRNNDFDYDRQIAAVYLQGARSLGPLQVQAGVRAEYAQRSFGTETPIPDLPGIPAPTPEEADVNYTSLFPSAFLTLPLDQISEGTLVKANYSRRIRRPNTSSLNPFPSFEDLSFVRVGNPTLRPAYTDSYELGFTYRYFLTVTPFYRRTTDVLNRNVFDNEEQDGQIFTFINAGTEDSYGVETSVFGRFGPVRGFVNGSLYQEATSGNAEVGVEATDALTWRASASVQGSVREGTDLQFFIFYRGPTEIPGGSREGFGFSSLGINQTLAENLRLSARLNDVFSTGRFRFETTQGDLITEREFDLNNQQISATLTWTFGSGQQRRPQQRPDQGGMDNDGFGM